jgi:hypothetical protein
VLLGERFFRREEAWNIAMRLAQSTAATRPIADGPA